jgi:hypothetical protein
MTNPCLQDPRAVWVFVHAEGLSFKKQIRLPSKKGPIACKRQRWKAHRNSARLTAPIFMLRCVALQKIAGDERMVAFGEREVTAE